MSIEIKQFADRIKDDLVSFTSELVKIQSYTGKEKDIALKINNKMIELGYDKVWIDKMGNVIGKIGNKGPKILFDSHIDTVRVEDQDEWLHPPFSGQIIENNLWGRGSVDMKSGAAASIYAGYALKQLDLAKNKTIYVTCTVMEEDCDGENLKHIFENENINPDYVVICEPSSCQLAIGHKGKAQVKIKTHGISAHGSAPEKGINAVYKIAQIIKRVDQLSEKLIKEKDKSGSIVLSNIECVSASLNAIPVECSIDLDRRIIETEDKSTIIEEMDNLVKDTDASWEIGNVLQKSWTGLDIEYHPFHLAWSIDLESDLGKSALLAYEQIFDKTPEIMKWDFSTNAVTSVEKSIPTIGFGPGDSKLAHMKDERCPTCEIVSAFQFYVALAEVI